ncbi:NAD(P)/FAD-dependent oxidoreductase [Erythrobacter sp. NE805]|uniref:NAD(P)/FAD-dependent oxidoreductase n=1 Tax=Erythrobacter sp. NE805 TaxID=3389875 RepID=UPI00396B3C66
MVGAGPAGLTAALYATRFRRATLVLHDGAARAGQIPLTRNVPGHDGGIAGPELLARMTRHAEGYGATLREARVVEAAREGGAFRLTDAAGVTHTARAVILATGVRHNRPQLPENVHQAAVDAGVLRYCPICDGFEHRDERIAVLGCDVSGAAEALFLRTYSGDVTLLPRRDVALTDEEQGDLERAGVHVLDHAVTRFEPTAQDIRLHCEGRAEPLVFDVLYPALGARPRSDLARMLGLALTEDGKAPDNASFGTAIPGLYAAGDLVEGLDQISVAMGHGAIAATRAHNWLREQDGATVEAVLGEDPEAAKD